MSPRILPITGIKAKLLAAHRAGVRSVILPKANERDLEEVGEEVLADLDVRFVQRVNEVLPLVLTEPLVSDEAGETGSAVV